MKSLRGFLSQVNRWVHGDDEFDTALLMSKRGITHRLSYLGIAQKASYQRNLFVAYFIVVIAILVITFGLWSQDPKPLSLSDAHLIKLNSFNAMVEEKGALSSDKRIRQTKPQPNGFWGFGIVLPETLPEISVTETPDLGEDLLVLDIEDGEFESYSPYSGNDTGIYVSASYVNFGVDQEDKIADTPRLMKPRKARIVSHYQPEYPLIAREEGVSGMVEIQVLVNKDGKAIPFTAEVRTKLGKRMMVEKEVEYLILTEQPTGYFFGKKAGEAVFKSGFSPPRDEYGMYTDALTVIPVFFLHPFSPPPDWYITWLADNPDYITNNIEWFTGNEMLINSEEWFSQSMAGLKFYLERIEPVIQQSCLSHDQTAKAD